MIQNLLLPALLLSLCTQLAGADIQSFKAPFASNGSIERYDPSFGELLAPNARMEILAEGFRWSEGPVWDTANNRLIFSDVPSNTAYAWTEKDGVSIFLRPSGHQEMNPEGINTAGSNGLMFTPDGQLALCQHGNRRIALYDEESKTFTTLVDHFGERVFYSPNDLVYDKSGNLFFTDPPYSLPRDKQIAIKTHYVYRRATDGTVTQIIDSIRYPNGIALSPDGKTLYLGSTDGKAPGLYAFDIDSNGNPTGDPRILLDATKYRSQSRKGGCDGMTVDEQGNIWTTGPGGVYVLNPNGKLLGLLTTEGSVANVTFGGPEDKTLYLTAANKLLRIQTKVAGLNN